MSVIDITEYIHRESDSSTGNLFVYHFSQKENPYSITIRDEITSQLIKNPTEKIEWIYGNSVLLDTEDNLYIGMKCNTSFIKGLYLSIQRTYENRNVIDLFAFRSSKELRIKLKCDGYKVLLKKNKINIKY